MRQGRDSSILTKTPSSSGKPWTSSQDAQLRREAAGDTPIRVIGLHLERTENAVRTRASELGVSLKPTNQSPYGTKKKQPHLSRVSS